MPIAPAELVAFLEHKFEKHSDVIGLHDFRIAATTELKQKVSVADIVRLTTNQPDFELITVHQPGSNEPFLCIWDLRKMNAATADIKRPGNKIVPVMTKIATGINVAIG